MSEKDGEKEEQDAIYQLCLERTRSHEKVFALEAQLQYAEARAENDRMYKLIDEINRRTAAARAKGWFLDPPPENL